MGKVTELVYEIVSVIANLAGAIFAGIQFARFIKISTGKAGKNQDPVLAFSTGLLAFAIPFFSPIAHNLGASTSFFIALAAVSTLISARCLKKPATTSREPN